MGMEKGMGMEMAMLRGESGMAKVMGMAGFSI